MERKPQQQTLSIRISNTLRNFLEESKDVIANERHESVSISDVAKVLLESARDDRLDFRLEVAELQQTPTESLFRIRRKWEQRNPLARAEWIFLAKYIRVACEEISENPMMPDHTLALVLEAFWRCAHFARIADSVSTGIIWAISACQMARYSMSGNTIRNWFRG
jgi:hypothetical protein